VDVRFGDARRLYQIAGNGRQAGSFEFIYLGCEIADVIFICSAISSETMFTTNSRVAEMLRRVSLRGSGPDFRVGQKQMTGGFALIAVKKLNGARLGMPSGLIVDTNAIGRGTIAPMSTL
jgi:hypothetical protein